MGAAPVSGGRAHPALGLQEGLPVNTPRMKAATGAMTAVLSLVGCDGLLEVSDPNNITADELDGNLPLVANGVEGTVHDVLDGWVLNQALLADVYQSTGTYESLEDIDHGHQQSALHSMGGAGAAWIRALWHANDAEERFRRVLGEAAAASSPLTAQVRLSNGLAHLYIGMTFCELTLESTGGLATDAEVLARADRILTEALATARAAGSPNHATAAQAGRAVARLLLDDWPGAQSDAAAVPAGFSYAAAFSVESENLLVRMSSESYERAAGLMYTLWPLIEISDQPGFMRDPWSGEPDPRLPVYFDGALADDDVTPFRGQRKYASLGDDIPIVHSDHMQLIIAESRARNGDYAGATAVLNQLRGAVGLPGHSVPASADVMEELILWERRAELFLEGYRLVDLHRKGIMQKVFDALEDPARPGEGRPSKWGECGPG